MEEAVLGSPCRLVDPCRLVGHLPALGAPARWTTLLPPPAAGGQVEGGASGGAGAPASGPYAALLPALVGGCSRVLDVEDWIAFVWDIG
jgi:hypothetical protein